MAESERIEKITRDAAIHAGVMAERAATASFLNQCGLVNGPYMAKLIAAGEHRK